MWQARLGTHCNKTVSLDKRKKLLDYVCQTVEGGVKPARCGLDRKMPPGCSWCLLVRLSDSTGEDPVLKDVPGRGCKTPLSLNTISSLVATESV